MSNFDREWMYDRILEDGFINPRFIDGVENFIAFAKRHPQCLDSDKLRCPCNHRKCQNKNILDEFTIMSHLGNFGFVPDYYRWYHHGESYIPYPSMLDYHQATSLGETVKLGEDPNPTTQHLYDLLKASEQEIWAGNPHGHSQLSVVARLLNLKAEHHFSERLYDELCQLLSELMPTDNIMSDSFYSTKKLMRGLGLPVEKIDSCKNGCMIYWREDNELVNCKFCSHPQFKRSKHQRSKQKTTISYKKMCYFPLTPRLQRLYASDATTKHMRCHFEHERDGVMRHPSDSPSWKNFDQTYSCFASEVRNVRLGLSTDGFQPFGPLGQQYSSWPVIVTPYNLPPWMCMKDEYMFLSMIIPTCFYL
ncbi:uncharacterized protein LOC132637405 [Lycium barbarum]|uniref:uncharacterized protein LOC132637405 n=1 Tax=Lycium barbarum TaxID=112863 RepID=UPI00293E69B8|nr:uncharacterized protein LOC132637405 [Lycium barbarum]XP_060210486.1 uncharacterized protein LOC132637405 [Lycium barbarum]XP_060210490.1 uncharacterized protein LOC132637405 [Lycium barbarum]